MPRLHGKSGRVYLALASGGTAEPVAFLNDWTINFSTDKAEVTAFEDENKTYVAGKPDAAGTFAGFYDDSTVQTYTAAVDGVARAFYLYPSTSANTKYFFGTIFPDMSISSGVAAAVSITSSWNAASNISKVG